MQVKAISEEKFGEYVFRVSVNIGIDILDYVYVVYNIYDIGEEIFGKWLTIHQSFPVYAKRSGGVATRKKLMEHKCDLWQWDDFTGPDPWVFSLDQSGQIMHAYTDIATCIHRRCS